MVAKCYYRCMSQPVKISDELLLDARLTAELSERSIAGQIEFWARLGRAIEPVLDGEKAIALRKSGDQKPLSALVASVDSNLGRQRVADYLSTQPYPHYLPVSGQPGCLLRVEESGVQTMGRFVNRRFVPAKKIDAVKVRETQKAQSESRSKKAGKRR
ncbi:hypothetical protein BH10CYA1_BH10CYA1_46300 [soil metagenome]